MTLWDYSQHIMHKLWCCQDFGDVGVCAKSDRSHVAVCMKIFLHYRLCSRTTLTHGPLLGFDFIFVLFKNHSGITITFLWFLLIRMTLTGW